MGIILKQARIKYMNSEKINTPPKRGKGGTGPCGLVPDAKVAIFTIQSCIFMKKKSKKFWRLKRSWKTYLKLMNWYLSNRK